MDIKTQIDEIRAEATAETTTQAHKNDIKYFWAWAWITRNIKPDYPIDPDLIEAYVVENVQGFDARTENLLTEYGYKRKPGKLAIATIRRRVNSIISYHRFKRHDPPIRPERIKELFRAAKKLESRSGRIVKKSDPITLDILLKLLKSIGGRTMIAKRNRAIISFGFFSGGRRRSEIEAAEYRFLKENKGGYIYFLHRSKADQAGQGEMKLISKKRAYPLKAWVKASGIKDGFLFRRIFAGRVSERPISGQLVNNIIKDHIEDIGLDPVDYSAHGLRRGFVTTCARAGVPITDIMQLTGHRDLRTIQGYIEQGQIENNKGARI